MSRGSRSWGGIREEVWKGRSVLLRELLAPGYSPRFLSKPECENDVAPPAPMALSTVWDEVTTFRETPAQLVQLWPHLGHRVLDVQLPGKMAGLRRFSLVNC